MKNKRKSGLIAIVILVAIIFFSVVSYFGMDLHGLYSAKQIKLGLDLAGGVSITYEAEGSPTDQEMNDTVEKLKKRVEGYSVESEVYREGSNRINVEIPGEQDVNKVLSDLGQPGTLSFKSEEAMSVIQKKSEAQLEKELKLSKDPKKQELYKQIKKPMTDEEIKNALELKEIPDVITGNDVKTAEAVNNQDKTTGQIEYNVALTLSKEGAKKFGDFTTKNVGKRLYIVYDGKVVSAPVVQTAITEGNVSISGQKTYEEAKNLATTIRIGALPVSLKEVRSNVVGAKLGQESISTSLKAGIIGFIIVVIFMIIIYRWAGFIGSLALGFFAVLMIFLISAFQLTLTLEGIAGVILSIGMAIDANIIIFTRIKEEIGLGKDIKVAIDEGFKKAFSAILDGNVTTLIAALVLWVIGSGTLKGFAQMLTLGIVLSMFTALTITKLLMKSFYQLGVKSVKCYGQITPRKKVLNILKYKFVFIVISIAFFITGIGFMFSNSKGGSNSLNYSLEFSGGTLTSVDMPKDMTLKEIDKELKPAISKIINDNDIRAQKVKNSKSIVIKTKSLSLEERTKLENMLVKQFKVNKSNITNENISSTISAELREKAVLSGVVTSILMLIYIWLRFKNVRFGASSVIALVHDCLIIVAFYAISRISVGSSFIAVILTIIGYSINATIVVFDRIRENIADNPKLDMSECVNMSITQTLSRCIYTSLTVAIMAFMLYILGVEAMKDFALPLLVGVIAGTWSSVGISGSLYYIFYNIKGKKTKIKA